VKHTENLEINTVTNKKNTESYLPLENRVSAKSVVTDLDNENSHYSDTEAVRRANRSRSANESKFRSLFSRFQIRHEPNLPRSHAAVDLVLVILCFAAVHISYLGNLDLSGQRSVALFSALVLIPLSIYASGLYNTKRLKSLSKELAILAFSWTFAFASIGLFVFLTKTAAEISRVWITSSMVLSLASLAGIRVLVSLGIMAFNEGQTKNIVLVGDASGVKSVIRNLIKLPNSPIQLARVFDISTHLDTSLQQTETVKFIGSSKSPSKQLTNFIEKERQSGAAIEQVWIAVSENQPQIIREISEALINSSVDVCVVPDQYAATLLKGDVTRYGGTDIVNISEVSLSPAADQFKRVCDVVITALALLLLSIPMLIIAGLIKLESKGPVLFRQKRYGVDGKEFEILKFRSMFVHADKDVKQAMKNDSRVTRVGRIIRKTSLDELPQLLNVLYGTMSLVGPRPHAVAHNELWRHEIQGYMLRHKVRPGITGWAQVNGWRGETDTHFKMQQRVTFDLEYISTWSPWLDLKILVLTVFVGFFHKNAY